MTYMRQLVKSNKNWHRLEDKRLELIIALNEEIENHSNGDLLLTGLQTLSINNFSPDVLVDFLSSFQYNNRPHNYSPELRDIISQFNRGFTRYYFANCVRNWFNFSNESFKDKNVTIKKVKFHQEYTDDSIFKMVVIFLYKNVEVEAKFLYDGKVILKSVELDFNDSSSTNYHNLYQFLTRLSH